MKDKFDARQLYAQFSVAFKNARLLTKQNEPLSARRYIIECMTVMRDLYAHAGSDAERKSLFAHVVEFQKISATLFDKGVTDEIKAWFGIAGSVGEKSQQNADSGENSQIDKIKNDDSIDWAENLFARYSRSVVAVEAKSSGFVSSGTGFVISEKGYLLTNDHVVFDERQCGFFKKITITTQDGKKAVPLKVINSDKKHDVALCRFDVSLTGDLPPVKRIKDYSKLLPGAYVLVIGNGLSMGLAPFIGTVRFVHDEDGNLVTTVPSNPGDSGGPVFNRKGECIGINKSVVSAVACGATLVEANGITNATPMDQIDALLSRWCDKCKIIL